MTESQLPESPVRGSPSQTLAFPVDQIGIWTSTLCVVHCLPTPVLLSLSAVSAHFLPSEERIHRTLAVAIATLGAITLVRVTGALALRACWCSWLLAWPLSSAPQIWATRLPSHGQRFSSLWLGAGS